jgi:hypothetical protein
VIQHYVEERTPKGYTLKIVQKKMSFLVFDRSGSSVYADPEGSQVVHPIPIVAFYGKDFALKGKVMGEYSLYKVSRGKIIIPYTLHGDPENRYLMIPTSETIDIMPVRAVYHEGLLALVRELDMGLNPGMIVVDDNASENDLIVIRNRCASAEIVPIGRDRVASGRDSEPRRAVDELDDVNLNMLSQNPVFLARIHLRNVAVSKVKQLLLDFDLTPVDAGYIHTFIQAMLNTTSSELDRVRPMLAELEKDFRFYVNVIEKKKKDAFAQIDEVETLQELTSFMTLLAKARSIHDERGTDLDMTDIENRIAEKQDVLRQ